MLLDVFLTSANQLRNMKEGSKDVLHGEGRLGLISSRLTLEGPVKKENSSFLISGRRTYIDLLAAPILAKKQKGKKDRTKPGYYFYDVNAKMNIDLSSNDKLYISGYFGRGRLKDLNFKTDFDFYPSADHALKFGAQAILHRFVPSALGNALTLPVSKYTGVREYFVGETVGSGDHFLGSQVSEYSGRGNFRAKAYHRTDVAAQFRKVKRRYERTWEIGI